MWMSSERLGLMLSALGLAVLSGCATPPPRGSGSGRVPVGWSTPAEAGDARVLPDDLLAFADEWSQSLMEDLGSLEEFAGRGPVATIVYGDIRNRTDIISSEEFELVRERIKDNLLKSRTFRERFRFLISRAQLEELRAQEVSDPGVGVRFDEEHTYLLNGSMFRIGRGDTHTYYFNFELVRFSDGAIIWSERYEGKRYGR